MVFVIFYVLPTADPAQLRAGREATPAQVDAIRHSLGLDKPVYAQYWIYMKDIVLHFDFGYSYQNNVSVKSQIFDRLPATLALAFGGMIIWLLIGIPIGILAARKHGTWIDKSAMGLAPVAISAPVYWLGLVSLYLFSNDIGKFPIFDGAGTYPSSGNVFTNPTAVIPSLILPCIVLAASFSRFVRKLPSPLHARIALRWTRTYASCRAIPASTSARSTASEK